jgi:hypothetical protein
MHKHFINVDEFCKIYDLGRTKTYALIKAGAIEARKVGARTKIVAASAERWAASLPPKSP